MTFCELLYKMYDSGTGVGFVIMLLAVSAAVSVCAICCVDISANLVKAFMSTFVKDKKEDDKQ